MNAPLAQTVRSTPLPEDISQQIEALRADVMRLAATVGDDLSAGIGKAGHQIGHTGRDARATAATAVTDHPLATIGFAAGLGLLLGLVVRKG